MLLIHFFFFSLALLIVFLHLLLCDGVCGRLMQTVMGCRCRGLNQLPLITVWMMRAIPIHDQLPLASQGAIF